MVVFPALAPKVAGFYSATRDRVMPPLRGLLLLRRVQTDENEAMRAILAHNEAVLAMLASIEERIEQAVQTLETLDGA